MKLPEPVCRLDDIFCSCGDPAWSWAWVYQYLLERSRNKPASFTSPAEQLVAHLLDAIGWTEHEGKLITHAHVTDDGLVVIRFLKRFGPMWQQWRWEDPENPDVVRGNPDGPSPGRGLAVAITN